jgi:5-methyltetrahydrofolate--homocysteine methyltransferase
MKTSSDIIKPIIAQSGGLEPIGRVVIGTVKGDLHDIGKNLVVMMLEGAGFEVTDLGINVPTEQLVERAQQTKANIVALSALLTTTMVTMKEVIEALKTAGLRKSVKVMIGGAPVTTRLADEIGADGYAPDAAGAAELAKRLV